MAGGGIDWQPWSREAFQRAADAEALVLLSITTTWSRGCARMMRDTYTDPRVIATVASRCIPVHVDADDRPDIAERYMLDGWPTTLLLTPEGEILNGVTFATADALVTLVDRTAALYSSDRTAVAARAGHARAARAAGSRLARESETALPAAIAAAMLVSADESRGGFVEEPRFVHGDALLFLLRYGVAAGDSRALAHARRTMLAIGESPMFDPDFGISRCADDRDWREPAGEYEAGTQAAALRVYAEGCAAGFDDRWRDGARRLADCVDRVWLPPAQERARFTDAAADLSGAALLCAAALENRPLARQAVTALEQAALATYRPGRGLAHSTDGRAPRLLLDHVLAIDALLDARDLTGELPYSMLAEELGWFVLGHFTDAEAGAFRDRVHAGESEPEVGLLGEYWHPFKANALAARALARLTAASGEQQFAEAAARAFAWTAGQWPRYGLDAAPCGLAALDLIDWRIPGPSEGHHTTR